MATKIVAEIEIALKRISIPSASETFCRSFRAVPSFIVTQGSTTLHPPRRTEVSCAFGAEEANLILKSPSRVPPKRLNTRSICPTNNYFGHQCVQVETLPAVLATLSRQREELHQPPRNPEVDVPARSSERLTVRSSPVSLLIDGDRHSNLSCVEHDQLHRFIARETTMRPLHSFRTGLSRAQNRAFSGIKLFQRKVSR